MSHNVVRLFCLLFLCIYYSCSELQKEREELDFIEQLTIENSKNEFLGISVPVKHKQLLYVESDSWESTKAKLCLLEYQLNDWVLIKDTITVSLGKNGMAWGGGLHLIDEINRLKKEGDKCSPAGIFSISTLFGYADDSLGRFKYPYKSCYGNNYFVDDVESDDYNTWQIIDQLNKDLPYKRWSSYEVMNRKDHLYEFGLVVNHNVDPVIKGAGSAIFFHVWRDKLSPTLGCTAMEAEDMSFILNWLEEEKYPLIIQRPKNVRLELK